MKYFCRTKKIETLFLKGSMAQKQTYVPPKKEVYQSFGSKINAVSMDERFLIGKMLPPLMTVSLPVKCRFHG